MSTVITDEEAKTNIGANLFRLRGEKSLYWLARQIGVSTIAVSRIERGLHMPGAGLLARIAQALGTTADELLGDPPKKSRRNR